MIENWARSSPCPAAQQHASVFQPGQHLPREGLHGECTVAAHVHAGASALAALCCFYLLLCRCTYTLSVLTRCTVARSIIWAMHLKKRISLTTQSGANSLVSLPHFFHPQYHVFTRAWNSALRIMPADVDVFANIMCATTLLHPAAHMHHGCCQAFAHAFVRLDKTRCTFCGPQTHNRQTERCRQ